MTFVPKDLDSLVCRVCGTVLTLLEYRRFGLCADCECEAVVERLPDFVPEAWSGEAA